MSIIKIQNDFSPIDNNINTFVLYERAIDLDFCAYGNILLKGSCVKVSDLFCIGEDVPDVLDFTHVSMLNDKIAAYKTDKYFDPKKVLKLMIVRKYLENDREFKRTKLISSKNKELGTSIFLLKI